MNFQSQDQPGHDGTTTTIRDGRTWQRGAPFLYIALLVLCELVAIRVLIAPVRSWDGTWPVALGYAWYFSMVSLVGLSLVLGSVRWPFRVLGGIIGLTVLVAIVRMMWTDEKDVIIIVVLQLTFLISLLAIGRGLRIYVVRADLKVRSPASQIGSKRTQLTISDLLLWTAGFAVLFWVVQSLRIDFSDVANTYREIVAFGGLFGAVAICAVCAALANTRWPLRSVVIAGAVPGLAEIVPVLLNGPPIDRPVWYSLVVAQLFFVGAAMLGLRAHGYRLVRASTADPTGTSDSPPGPSNSDLN